MSGNQQPYKSVEKPSDHLNKHNLVMKLPVYKLTGGTEEQRALFTQKLVAALERFQICVKMFRYEEPTLSALTMQARLVDLVLIDRFVDFTTRQIILDERSRHSPDDLVWQGGDDGAFALFIEDLVGSLSNLVNEVPVWACILIGGKSSRMGQPKHLLAHGSETAISWLEHAVQTLEPMVDGLVVSGKGDLPESCRELPRLPDIPGIRGPLTGVVSASRWQPFVNWLIVACDMPNISGPAVEWLLSSQRSGCWGRVPRLAESEFCEPLFALYDFRGTQLFEEQQLQNIFRVSKIANHCKIDNPIIPDHLRNSWKNINTPTELESLQ